MADLFPDSEGGLRTWLRTLTTVTTATSQRQWFGVPDDADESDFPAIIIQRVGGKPDTSEAPVDMPMIQLSIVGTRRDKAGASALTLYLVGELMGIRQPTAWGASAMCLGCSVESVIFLADPADARPRYVVTFTASVIAV